MTDNNLIFLMYFVFNIAVLHQIIGADRELEREIHRVRTTHSSNSRSDTNRDINTDQNNNNRTEPNRNSVTTDRR